jgi:hydroxymethylglutaryl-CoA reductase
LSIFVSKQHGRRRSEDLSSNTVTSGRPSKHVKILRRVDALAHARETSGNARKMSDSLSKDIARNGRRNNHVKSLKKCILLMRARRKSAVD